MGITCLVKIHLELIQVAEFHRRAAVKNEENVRVG
jgi:hypothetical protein